MYDFQKEKHMDNYTAGGNRAPYGFPAPDCNYVTGKQEVHAVHFGYSIRQNSFM